MPFIDLSNLLVCYSYTHQGWVLDPNNQEYLLLDDEYDEYDGKYFGSLSTYVLIDCHSGVGPAADGFPGTAARNRKMIGRLIARFSYLHLQHQIPC